MARLVVVTDGPLGGKVFPIEQGLTIGREAHNTIAMPDNRKCSRDHAKVWKSGVNRFEIADLGSTNGTLVNDDKITRTALRDGDLITIGEVQFRFEMPEAEVPGPKPAEERASLADVISGKARPKGAAAAEGPAAIEIKQRILQYHKKSGRGTALGEDIGQSAGLRRWLMIGIALAVAVGLFFLVRTLVTGMRDEEPPPAEGTSEPP